MSNYYMTCYIVNEYIRIQNYYIDLEFVIYIYIYIYIRVLIDRA